MIVDPGAWTNLMGANLAKQLAERAVKAGHTPVQERMQQPLSIQGVGNGYQKCSHELTTPIAVPDQDGKVTVHSLTAPIVEGTGADIPGLLGLRSLESLGAVLDMGNHELILPGAGEVQYEWPPGTTRIPLQKAPSGHLVMIIDDYERVIKDPSGLPERTVELLASSPGSAASQSSSAGATVVTQQRPDTGAAAAPAHPAGRQFEI